MNDLKYTKETHDGQKTLDGFQRAGDAGESKGEYKNGI
jgi:hypothetical protein